MENINWCLIAGPQVIVTIAYGEPALENKKQKCISNELQEYK